MKVLLYITYGVLIGLLAGGVIWLSTSRSPGEPVALLSSPTPSRLVVYVSGAVVNPGLYSLAPDSRIGDAVQAAGGVAPGGDASSLNFAVIVHDGDQINVPGVVDTSHVNTGRVNINTASLDELDALPGIGPTTAQNIVDYRNANGPFQVIQDIQNVPGVGLAVYDRIKDYITVTP